jgi:aryl sulfotransferase
MTPDVIDWPVKTREIETRLWDSTRWSGLEFHDGDVVVATWSKTGTTWTQQIVWQLLNGGPEGVFSISECPCVDMRLPNRAEMLADVAAQHGRRNLKTHLPLDALVFSPKAKYLYVARDARDTIWSLFNHQEGFSDQWLELLNAVPGDWPPVARPGMGVREYYLEWLKHDEPPGDLMLGVSFWDHVQGWWNARDLPNVLLVHFNNLKADLAGEARSIARFLEIEVDEAKWPSILEHCAFDYMQSAATGGMLDILFVNGALTFFNKGTNGRWSDVLSLAEVAQCDEVAERRLTPGCAHWLRTGRLLG